MADSSQTQTQTQLLSLEVRPPAFKDVRTSGTVIDRARPLCEVHPDA